jgi:hypothetical protein
MISKIEKLIEVFFRVISRYSSKLYTFHSRPRYARLFEKKSHAFNYAELCVIIQGDIKNINFLQETIQIYKNCVFPGSCILISTWYDENKKHLRSIEKLGVEVLVSEKPENRGASNINLQITSTRRAVECAALKNVRYLMKTRTDQRINAVNTYPYLLALTKQFPPSSAENGGRLIGLSLNSFKYRLYGISDMFMFGSLNEMQKYWSPPLIFARIFQISTLRSLLDDKIFRNNRSRNFMDARGQSCGL